MATPAPTATKKLPLVDYNVLLLVLDDIGAEWFSFYGIGDRFTTDASFAYCHTPVIGRLAQYGLAFLEGYANPVCGPTRACLHTGQYAFRTGFGENLRDPSSPPFPPNVIGHRLSDSLNWLPRAIHQARPGVYDTAIFGKWHLADGYSTVVTGPMPPPDINLDHASAVGYDESAIHIPNMVDHYGWFRVVNGVVQPSGGYTSPPFTTANWAPSVHAADAAAWIASRIKPWFVNLSINAPHSPFMVPPFNLLSAATIAELTTAGLSPGMMVPTSTSGYPQTKLIWRAAMESVDTCVGQVLASLTLAELAKTMVIVCGDNGTIINALPPGFLHSKRDVYRGGTQVPFLINGPLVVNAGRQPTDLAHAVDVHATVLDIVGGTPPASIRDQDGISLMPVIQDQPGKRRRLFTEAWRPWGELNPANQHTLQRALFDGRWRYVNRFGTSELYDDHADFIEAVDVAASHPAVAAQMKRELEELVGS